MAEAFVGRKYSLELILGPVLAVPMLTTTHIAHGTQVWWTGPRRPLPPAPTVMWVLDELYLANLDAQEAHTHLG